MQPRPAIDPSTIRHDYAKVGDVRLHYVECGYQDDELVIL